jgi:type I restriction enzyme M protein
VQKRRAVSKIFDNEDFGYHKITVERPLRLNFQATAERIARIEEVGGFRNLATSAKKDAKVREKEIEAGEQRQEALRVFLRSVGEATSEKLFKDRKAFLKALRDLDHKNGINLTATELRAVLAALGERDNTAEICRDRNGMPEPDVDLRDTENVPLKEGIHAYFKREVLPHVPDAWIDESKTKVGYEIPLNRHFYIFEPPRSLEVIDADIKVLEAVIVDLLKEITA